MPKQIKYLPILRWKRGERIGLRSLTQQGKEDVVPLIVVAPDQYRGKPPNASKPAISAAANFIQELINAWGTSPIYIDASAVPHSVGNSPIADIAVEAQKVSASIIPATWLNAPPAYQQAVQVFVQTYQSGVGLRVDLQEFATANSWAAAWPHSLNETDLIVDFADNVTNVAALGVALNPTFQNLHKGNKWRTVTMSGSVMPGNFSGYNSGLHTLTRRELSLWHQLSAAGLPYILHYGDYTSVSPNAAPQGIAWGFPINVRYTLASDFLICRGVRTTGFGGVDMDQQLLGHAKDIAGYPARGPLNYSWADPKIDNMAAGTDSVGNLETWVQIGVNRHIELTRRNLP